MQILDVKWKSVDKRFTGILHGDRTYKGTLQLLVDKIPHPKCKWIGRFVYGEEDGFCRVYEWEPGSTRAFANSPITVHFEDGTTRVFVGDLWDPHHVSERVPDHRHISITTEQRVMNRGHTFYGGKITRALWDKLIDRVKLEREVLYRQF